MGTHSIATLLVVVSKVLRSGRPRSFRQRTDADVVTRFVGQISVHVDDERSVGLVSEKEGSEESAPNHQGELT
jgi:hypothetical protein